MRCGNVGPGHFLEVRKLLPLLTEASPDHPSFHVVAPSLPNFGFSEAATKRGFRGDQYAEVVNKLMLALGYDEYGACGRACWPVVVGADVRCWGVVVQGGDWGSFVRPPRDY